MVMVTWSQPASTDDKYLTRDFVSSLTDSDFSFS